jgi:hypothetical protein
VGFLASERHAKPSAAVTVRVGVHRPQRRQHLGGGGETVGAGVGVGEVIEVVESLDRFDRQPPDARRPRPLARLHARRVPSADGRPLGPATDGVEENLFEQELRHGSW